MRLYMGSGSQSSLTEVRSRVPSNTVGRVWTPHDAGRDGAPYIVDNGEYYAAQNGEEWRVEDWTDLLEKVVAHPWPPDFVVLPDVYNDAEGTLERHRKHVGAVLDRDLPPAAVVQPGIDEQLQVRLANQIGAKVVFVGGDNTWKRAVGEEIVAEAHRLNMAVHIGNPGVPGGLRWAQRIGADSVDTASITRSEAWHHLKELEPAHSSRGAGKNPSQQARVSDYQ
jgi:hypothetical protein